VAGKDRCDARDRFHPNDFVERHEWRGRLAVTDVLDGPHFRNAAGAHFGVVRIWDRTRTDDRAGYQIARARGVGDETWKPTSIAPPVSAPEGLAVPFNDQVQAPAIPPAIAQAVRGYTVTKLDTWLVTHENLRGIPRVRAFFDTLVEAFEMITWMSGSADVGAAT
jgi:hypothetical protein